MFFSQTDNISQLSYLDSWLKSEVKKLGIDESVVKTFKKAYYEIRFNLQDIFYMESSLFKIISEPVSSSLFLEGITQISQKKEENTGITGNSILFK